MAFPTTRSSVIIGIGNIFACGAAFLSTLCKHVYGYLVCLGTSWCHNKGARMGIKMPKIGADGIVNIYQQYERREKA